MEKKATYAGPVMPPTSTSTTKIPASRHSKSTVKRSASPSSKSTVKRSASPPRKLILLSSPLPPKLTKSVEGGDRRKKVTEIRKDRWHQRSRTSAMSPIRSEPRKTDSTVAGFTVPGLPTAKTDEVNQHHMHIALAVASSLLKVSRQLADLSSDVMNHVPVLLQNWDNDPRRVDKIEKAILWLSDVSKNFGFSDQL